MHKIASNEYVKDLSANFYLTFHGFIIQNYNNYMGNNNNFYNGQWNPVAAGPPPQMPSTSAEVKVKVEVKEEDLKTEKPNPLNFNQPPPPPPSSQPATNGTYFNNISRKYFVKICFAVKGIDLHK